MGFERNKKRKKADTLDVVYISTTQSSWPKQHSAIIEDLDEAKQYLAHPVLGTRLKEISEVLLSLETNDPYKVMGDIDALKPC